MAFRIAPRGWDHDAWGGSFYPGDLPREWRLIYFSNHFDAVLVPEHQWRDPPLEVLPLWREESRPGMRFYLEAAELPPSTEGGAVATALGEGFGGFIAPDGGRMEGSAVGRWRGDAADLRGLRAAIEALAAANEGEALLIVEGEPPSLEAARAARVIARLLGLS